MKLLFVCRANLVRSKTAEDIFLDDPRFEVKSAGISKSAKNPATQQLIDWADYVIVMEKYQEDFIRQHFKPKHLICFYIDEIYEYMDASLVKILKEKMSEVFD